MPFFFVHFYFRFGNYHFLLIYCGKLKLVIMAVMIVMITSNPGKASSNISPTSVRSWDSQSYHIVTICSTLICIFFFAFYFFVNNVISECWQSTERNKKEESLMITRLLNLLNWCSRKGFWFAKRTSYS